MNRFKGLDLQTEYLKNYGQVCNILQEAANQTIPKKKKNKKVKWLSEEALQIAEEEKQQKARGKGKGCRFPKNKKERQEDLLQ